MPSCRRLNCNKCLWAMLPNVCGMLDVDVLHHMQVRQRKTGNTAGTNDVYYKTPEGKRFRSKREVVTHLGLTPVVEPRRSGPSGSPAAPRNPWTMSKPAVSSANASAKPRCELASAAAALAAKTPLALPAACAHGVTVHRCRPLPASVQPQPASCGAEWQQQLSLLVSKRHRLHALALVLGVVCHGWADHTTTHVLQAWCCGCFMFKSCQVRADSAEESHEPRRPGVISRSSSRAWVCISCFCDVGRMR